MHNNIKAFIRTVILLGCICSFIPAKASHIAGGEMTYVYLGDSLSYHRYWVTLIIYEDCMHGLPEVIAQDNPAFLAVYSATSPYTFIRKDSVPYSYSTVVPQFINTPCGNNASTTAGCTLKKTFIYRIALPSNTSGYTVVYDRCCRNSATVNVNQPDEVGITLSCTIPPYTTPNNSAVFNNLPIQNAAINKSFGFDFSATDPDGDSLSYEMCPALKGGDQNDVKPWPPYAPPFDAVIYNSPYTYDNPIKCAAPMQLDPVTGMLTGTATQTGLYLVAASCHEWRNGVMINTIIREQEVLVTSYTSSPYKPYGGGDVTLLVGEHYQFNAIGAKIYTWSPGTYLDNPNIANPTGYFTDPGQFTYTLHGVSDSGCVGDDIIHVTVLANSYFAVPNAFSPNGDGINDILAPIPIGNSTLTDFRIFNRWGNQVFQADNIQNAWWDGKYKGKRQDMGIFFWELKFLDNNGKPQLVKGNVTLVR